jgi:hypothetical protein
MQKEKNEPADKKMQNVLDFSKPIYYIVCENFHSVKYITV